MENTVFNFKKVDLKAEVYYANMLVILKLKKTSVCVMLERKQRTELSSYTLCSV